MYINHAQGFFFIVSDFGFEHQLQYCIHLFLSSKPDNISQKKLNRFVFVLMFCNNSVFIQRNPRLSRHIFYNCKTLFKHK